MPEQPPDPLHYDMRIPPEPSKSNQPGSKNPSPDLDRAAPHTSNESGAAEDATKPESARNST